MNYVREQAPSGDTIFVVRVSALHPGLELWCHAACGMAFDYGRALGNLELRQVMLDREMSEDPDERVRRLAEENSRQRKENDELHLMLNRHGFNTVHRGEPGSARLLQGLDPDDWVERLWRSPVRGDGLGRVEEEDPMIQEVTREAYETWRANGR